MARPSFAQMLQDAQQRGKIILMDGPMATELQHSGFNLENESAHSWNLTHPEAIKVVYEDYTNAGAEVLLTNTFSAHLGIQRGDPDWKAAVQAGIALAREPEWDHLYTVGSIGTVAGDDATAITAIHQVVDSLSSCDALLLETQTRLDRVKAVVRPENPMMVSFSFGRLPRSDRCWVAGSAHGDELEAQDVTRWAQKAKPVALGVNCGINLRLDDFVAIAQAYRSVCDLPILVRPGITPSIECEFSPKEYAEKVRVLADAGVTLLGGCCGTTPAHISALRKEIDRLGLGWQT